MHAFGTHTKCVHVFSFESIVFCLILQTNSITAMDKELFKTIDTIIRQERLYAQVNLLREDIMKRFGIGRHHLNDQLNAFADGMSFPQYINSIRMEVAHDLLTNHPEMPIADVAREVGFTAPNLREQFKRCYGITPTEYRAGLVTHDDE